MLCFYFFFLKKIKRLQLCKNPQKTRQHTNTQHQTKQNNQERKTNKTASVLNYTKTNKQT